MEESLSNSENIRSVVKSNRIIEAKYRLNAREQKFILYMVSLIKPEDDSFRFHRVKISEFEKILNSDGRKWGGIHQAVKEIVLSLNDKPLIMTSEDGKKQQIINWVASAEIETGSGIIEFEFSEKLKPYLLQLKSHFTKFNLENIVRMKSGFSIRLYELLKSHQYQGKIEYELGELKRLLGVAEKYDDYKDFKKRVLNVAQTELTEKSDIKFAFKEIRENRRIKSIHFQINENKSDGKEEKTALKTSKSAEKSQVTTEKTPERVAEASPFAQALVAIGFTKTKANDIIAQGFGIIKDEDTRQKVEKRFSEPTFWLEERLAFFEKERTKGTISNPQGFFTRLLQDNYTHAEAEKQDKQQMWQQKAAEQALEKKEKEKILKKMGDDLWAEKTQIALNLLRKTPKLLDELNEGDGSLLFKGDYKKHLSAAENLEAVPTHLRVWVISKIENYTPQYFAHLKAQETAITQLRREILMM